MPENQVPNKLSYEQLVQRVKALEQENEQLRKTEERYKLAFEATDDGIWDYNPQNGSVFFSSRVFAMLGYEQGELPGGYESWTALLHPEDRDRSEASLKQFAENPEENFSAEFRIRRKNGHPSKVLYTQCRFRKISPERAK